MVVCPNAMEVNHRCQRGAPQRKNNGLASEGLNRLNSQWMRPGTRLSTPIAPRLRAGGSGDRAATAWSNRPMFLNSAIRANTSSVSQRETPCGRTGDQETTRNQFANGCMHPKYSPVRLLSPAPLAPAVCPRPPHQFQHFTHPPIQRELPGYLLCIDAFHGLQAVGRDLDKTRTHLWRSTSANCAADAARKNRGRCWACGARSGRSPGGERFPEPCRSGRPGNGRRRCPGPPAAATGLGSAGRPGDTDRPVQFPSSYKHAVEDWHCPLPICPATTLSSRNWAVVRARFS